MNAGTDAEARLPAAAFPPVTRGEDAPPISRP